MPDSPPHDPEAMQAAEPQAQPIEVMTGLVSAGFAKLSRQRRKVLRIVLAATLGVHVLAMLVFGGVVLARYLRQEETVFVAPPPARTYEPRKVELKVKVQRRQRSSSRPAIVPRLVSARPSAIVLPAIKLDPKLVTTTFQPKFKAVGGRGLGAGLGTGYGTSGFGEGVSTIDFFGIRAQGERIAVLVDVSVSMVEEERGGPAGFVRVRERVGQVVDALKDGTLFTVVAFADACSVMSSEMVYAGSDTRQRAKAFLNAFNTEGNYGLDHGNFTPPAGVGLPAAGGTTRLDLALTAAMMQGADTIMIISDGLPQVTKVRDPAAVKAHAERVAQWYREHAAELESYDRQAVQAEVRRVWVPPQPARPPSKGPLKEGVKPDPGAPARPGYWREERVVAGGRSRPAPPSLPPPGKWTLADFIQHMNLLYESVYKPKGLKPPRVHCIGYQIDKDGGAFLNGLARHFHGEYRLVRKLR
jgi:hypothetical protein